MHIINPLAFNGRTRGQWRSGLTAAQDCMASPADTAGAVTVVGDFDSTPDMRQFRNLPGNGYRDACPIDGCRICADLPALPRGFRPTRVSVANHSRFCTHGNAAASSIHHDPPGGSDHRSTASGVSGI